jgi:hypothetical protein
MIVSLSREDENALFPPEVDIFANSMTNGNDDDEQNGSNPIATSSTRLMQPQPPLPLIPPPPPELIKSFEGIERHGKFQLGLTSISFTHLEPTDDYVRKLGKSRLLSKEEMTLNYHFVEQSMMLAKRRTTDRELEVLDRLKLDSQSTSTPIIDEEHWQANDEEENQPLLEQRQRTDANATTASERTALLSDSSSNDAAVTNRCCAIV